MRQVARPQRRELSVETFTVAAEVLRLHALSSPAAGASAVKEQRTADATIGIAPRQHSLDFVSRPVRSRQA